MKVPPQSLVADSKPMPKRRIKAPKGLVTVSKSASKKRAKVTHKGYIFLRVWREKSDLSLREVADRLGIGVSTLHGWENGDRQVDLGDLTLLAKEYGVHPTALLMHPKDASPILDNMREASDVARDLDEETLGHWLALGRKLRKRRKS